MQAMKGKVARVDWAGSISKMVRCIGMALIGVAGVLWAGAAQAQNVQCSADTKPNTSFGTVDVLKPAAVIAATPTLQYSCVVTGFPNSGYGQICINIDGGTAGSGDSAPYQSRLLQKGSDKLNFDIYQDSSHTIPWGTQHDAASGGPRVVSFQAAKNGKAPKFLPELLYVMLLPQQNKTSGLYQSTLNAEFTWATLPSTTVNPALCGASAGTFTFTVDANVANKCYFTTTDLNFGSVSSLAAGPIVGQSAINVQCSNGTSYQVGLDNGLNSTGGTNRSMRNAMGGLVRYDLYQDAGRSTRWGNNSAPGGDTLNNRIGTGNPTAITVYGQVFPTSLVTAGDYADTVTVTIYY